MKEVRATSSSSEKELELSIDAKATVKIGEFSRGGLSRVPTQALDHDYQADDMVTPLGILLPQQGDVDFYMVTTKATSDCIVDCLDAWWVGKRPRFSKVERLTILLDNGPQCNGRRTQFLKRMVDFVDTHKIAVRLAYYPPYHSKYNPIERCWGGLEKHWNGSLLDSRDAVVNFASTMTWKGAHPSVSLVTTLYEDGVKIARRLMKSIEKRLRRHSGLEPYFIDIPCAAPTG